MHPAFNTLARSIAPDIEIYRFDINEDWRAGVRASRTSVCNSSVSQLKMAFLVGIGKMPRVLASQFEKAVPIRAALCLDPRTFLMTESTYSVRFMGGRIDDCINEWPQD